MIEPVAHLTILMIELREIEPRLWRRVDEPLSSALLALHDIIQVAFLSTNSHLCEFVVGEHVYGEPMPDDDFFDGTERAQSRWCPSEGAHRAWR